MKAKALLVTRAALLLALAVMAWRGMNYFSNAEPGPDSSIFMSAGWHALHGRALYKDQLTGPPMIYALNAIALALGDNGINSVRVMERVFAVIGVAAFFVASLLAFQRFWLAWVASVLYLMHLFRAFVIEHGNVTEEYGGVFLLLGIGGVIAAVRWTGHKRLVAGGLAGAAFSLAVMCKEPFVLIVPVWFVFLAWPRERNWADARARALAFLAGVAMLGVAFVGYLATIGAWTAWLHSISASLAYTAAGPVHESSLALLYDKLYEKMNPMLVVMVAAGLGVIGLFARRAQRNRDGLPLAIAASTVMSLWSLSIGGRYYGHYFMFFVGSFFLLAASGIAFATDLVASERRRMAGAVVVALVLAAVNIEDVTAFARSLTLPARAWQGHWLTEMLRRNTAATDPIWTPWKPLLYVESRRLSPTRWQSVFDIYFVDTPDKSGTEKFRELREELAAKPPVAIVISALPGSGPTRGPADAFLRRSGLSAWVAANYQSVMCTSQGNTDLLFRKGALPAPGATPLTSDSVAMFVGTASLYERGDPTMAVACFRMTLARTPEHYGAAYQLAKALDFMDQRDEATTMWRKVLTASRKFGDKTTEAQAIERLR